MVDEDIKLCVGNCQQVSSGQLAICLLAMSLSSLLARSKNLLNLTTTDIRRQMHHSLLLTLRNFSVVFLQHMMDSTCLYMLQQTRGCPYLSPIIAALFLEVAPKPWAACCKQIFASSGVLVVVAARWSPKVFLAEGLLSRNQSQKHSMVRALAGLCDPRKNARIAPSCEMM